MHQSEIYNIEHLLKSVKQLEIKTHLAYNRDMLNRIDEVHHISIAIKVHQAYGDGDTTGSMDTSNSW